jgi:hypothetical protein
MPFLPQATPYARCESPGAIRAMSAHHSRITTPRPSQHRTSGSRRAFSHSHTPSRVLGGLERCLGFILHFNLPFS